MRNPQEWKFFLVLFTCSLFIFGFSTYGAMGYDRFFGKVDQFAANTKIGTIDVSGLDPTEALSKLKEKQKNWSEKTEMIVVYNEKSSKINLNLFHFQLEKSLQSAKNGQQTELQVDLNNQSLAAFLEKLSKNLSKERAVDLTRIKTDLIGYASLLSTGTHTIPLNNYLVKKQPDKVISESTIPYRETDFELMDWAEKFPQIEIMPESSFSLMEFLEKNHLKNYSSNSLSMIATAIYKTILPTNFLITERHISRELPAYAEAGYEAKVDQNNHMDFVVTNPNNQKYQLNFKIINNLFYVSLKGQPFSYTYDILLKDKETFQPKTVVQYDAKLPFNREIVKTQGKKGILVKVYRYKVDEDGNTLEKTLLAEDFYLPINRLVFHSLLVNEQQTSETNADGTVTGTENADTGNNGTKNGNKENGNSADSSNETDQKTGKGQSNQGTKNSDQTTNEARNSGDLWGKPNEAAK